MKKLFKKYNIELSQEELEKFEKFLKIFKEKNSKINLSAIREDEEIIEKHFIDSIMLNIFLEFQNPSTSTTLQWLPLTSRGEENKVKVADIWTGWGFPWIPLAIINPQVELSLMDSVWKKIKSVEEFVQSLDLKNIDTVNDRAENIWQNPEYREKFDYVVSRATAYFPTLLEYAIPLLKVWWVFIAYKLDDKEELKSAKKALSRLSAKILKIKNYSLNDQKRTLVFIEKKSPTHKKYPRKVGLPLKEPIK